MQDTPGRHSVDLAGRHAPELLIGRDAAGRAVLRLSRPAARLAVLTGLALCVWAVVATSLVALNALEDAGASATVAMAPAALAPAAAPAASAAAAQAEAALAALAARQDALAAEAATRGALEAEAAALRARVAALTRALGEADAARREAETARAEAEGGFLAAAVERDELAETLQRLSAALDATAAARDDAEAQTVEFVDALGQMEAGAEAARDRQARLLSEIERAAELSIVPLQTMLQSAGVNVERIIEELRREAGGGSGGPFLPAEAAEAAPEQAVAVIEDLETVRLLQTAAKRMPFAAPVRNPRFTSGFGVRRDPFNRRLARHEGLDMAGPAGTPILAPADGVVTFAGVQRGYGRMVKIRHHFGFETIYAHLSKVRVAKGQTVRRGARLGDMGNTGRSTGTHLHYEIHVDGKPVNPRKFIEAARNVL